MTKPLIAPPSNSNTGADIYAAFAHRESHDDYANIVVQLTRRWRIILCPESLQWIIQEKESSHAGTWSARKYVTSRNGLLKACGKLCLLSDSCAEAVLHALPEYVSQLAKK